MNKVALAMLASVFLLLAPASSAVEGSPSLKVGDKWGLGHEFDVMEEFNTLTEELFEEVDAEIENNSTGEYEDLMGYNILQNKGVIGIYYTGEVLDDLDGSLHIKSEEAFYIHTAIDTTITAVGFEEGTFNDVEEKCTSDDNDDWSCTYTQADGTEMPTKEFTMGIGGSFHYVTKITTETWWTQDDFRMEKMDITLSMGAQGGVKLLNVPNETMELKMIPVDYDDDGNTDYEDRDCEYDHEKDEETCNYEYIDTVMETAILQAESEVSFHFVFEFTEPMNVLDLPLGPDEFWTGETGVTVSGDMGGMIDIDKPVLSICPNLDCDQMPEMQELYEGLTLGFEELHENETFSITVDRNGDGLPDVIDEWSDIFPIYVPENWMDDIFQEILEEISCDDQESAQEGEDCDETAEEELKKMDLRIENNRFAFGPYTLTDPESGDPIQIPYAFETSDEKYGRDSDNKLIAGYQVFPADRCSDKNPNKEEDCGDEEENEEEEGPFGSKASDDCDPEWEDCPCSSYEDPEPFCDAVMEYFHDANTGQLAFMEMDLPYATDAGYQVKMIATTDEAEVAAMNDKINNNADPAEPTGNDAGISYCPVEGCPDKEDDGWWPVPGFGLAATVGSLMIAGRRFRK